MTALPAIFLLAACLLFTGSQAYSRRFQSPDEDVFSYDGDYWRPKKVEQRANADLEAYLRQMMMMQMPAALSALRRQPLHQHQHLPGQHHHHNADWPAELQPLALQRAQQEYEMQMLAAQQAAEAGASGGGGSSDFAVPPSDIRFFDPPPRVDKPHLYYRDTPDDNVGGPRGPGADDLTTALPPELTTTTTIEVEEETEEVVKTPLIDLPSTEDNILLVAVVAGSSTAAVGGVALLIYGILRLQKKAKDAADVEYPAYGVTGPNKEATPTGDRRLAHSAQMYHYQLTKQQIIAMESSGRGERRGSVSEADSEDDENEEGDYTVYECPGLAPTGEMEVKNPLFQDETTPANNDQTKE